MSFISILRQALYEESMKHYSRAFNSYNKAIAETPNPRTIARLTARKGWCQQYIGNQEQAIQTFTDLAKNAEVPQAYLLTAIYYIKTDKLKSAKNMLNKGIEKFPDYLELYLTLASLLKDTERANESILVLRKALSQEKLTRGKGGIERKDIWAELGNLYYERGSYNSCIVSLKRSLKMDLEKNFLHYALLAKSYLKLNDPFNALKYIDLHLSFFEDLDPEDFITKARAHARLGDNHLASANLLQAYDSDGFLRLRTDEMADFSVLVQNGFFTTLENLEIY
ncbi:MAG: hypothetical protein IPL26_01550 [Leptospiraceae bacterium]|nr:hypothetical protein [Leptospiraceae bacterium]